jgi:hypothetical protein
MAGRSNRREAALAALLVKPTIEAAAAEAGVSTRTLKNWLAEPGFRAEYRAARRQLVDDAVRLLQRAAVAAVGALVAQLRADNPAVVARAAVAILNLGFRGAELTDLAEAVEDLRRQVEEARRVYGDARPGGGATAGGAGPAAGGGRPALPDPGSGPADDRGGPDAGPVAGGTDALFG